MIAEKQYKIRLDTFNLIKGILMIFIVLCHKVPHYNFEFGENILHGMISSILNCLKYGVNPAFFIISGFGFRVTSQKKCLKKAVSELLKPYLFVMLAYAVFFPLCHYAAFHWWPGALHESTSYFLTFLLGIPKVGKVILGYNLYECSVVWFFLALFVAHNILNWILNVQEKKLRPVLVLLCFVTGYILTQFDLNYYCIPQGLIGVGYCYAGYLVKKTMFYNNKKLPLVCVILAVLGGIQGKWGYFSLTGGFFRYGILDCVLAGCTGLLWLFVGIMLSNTEKRIFDPIKNIGVYTYWLMCVHSVEMSCIPWYLWRERMQNSPFIGLCIEVIIAGLILTAGCVMLKEISKHRYRKQLAPR